MQDVYECAICSTQLKYIQRNVSSLLCPPRLCFLPCHCPSALFLEVAVFLPLSLLSQRRVYIGNIMLTPSYGFL